MEEVPQKPVDPVNEEPVGVDEPTVIEEPIVKEEQKGITSIDLDFLPIVIDADKEEKAEIETPEKTIDNTDEEPQPKASVERIEHSVDEDRTDEELHIEDIAFLPFVVENTPQEKTEDELIEDSQIDDTEHTDEQGESTPKAEMQNKDLENKKGQEIESFDELNFIPIVTDNENVIENTSDIEEEMAFDGFLDWPFEESQDEKSIDLNFAPSEPDGIPIENEITRNAEVEAILNALPKPEYYDEETIITMRLLDDIEELGDQRENILLDELFEKSSTTYIKERIIEIKRKFETGSPKKDTKKVVRSVSQEFKPFSVFDDLFRTCDLETKLILMDEIVEVGDEKEIHFLNNLLKDPEIKIREKAQPILEELQKKIFHKSLLFEPHKAFEENSKIPKTNKTNVSLIDQLLSIPNKIIEKFNG